MKVSMRTATVSAIGVSLMLASGPAFAQGSRIQRQNQEEQAQPRQRGQQQEQGGLRLSRAEQAALQPLSAAIQARDWAAAQAALPAAQAAAQSNDARLFVAQASYQIGSNTQNVQLESQAIDTLIELPNLPQNLRVPLLTRQAELAFNANDFAKAERAYVRVLEIMPNDPGVTSNLAVVRRRMGNESGALDALMQTIQQQEAANQRADEQLYQRALRSAVEARRSDAVADLTRRWLTAYPTPQNWRAAIDVARAGGGNDVQFSLDAFRLMRAVGALRTGDEYNALATTLGQAALSGEVKAVLEEAISRNLVQRAAVASTLQTAETRIAEDRRELDGQITSARAASTGREARIVADALFGYGRYAEAIDLYRVALTKGGEDANLINTRIGMSHAMAGQRSEAETAFRAVTGNRAPLASLWMVWLTRPQG